MQRTSRFTSSGGSPPVGGVMRRLRRLELRSNSVVIDAYDRDIGGE